MTPNSPRNPQPAARTGGSRIFLHQHTDFTQALQGRRLRRLAGSGSVGWHSCRSDDGADSMTVSAAAAAQGQQRDDGMGHPQLLGRRRGATGQVAEGLAGTPERPPGCEPDWNGRREQNPAPHLCQLVRIVCRELMIMLESPPWSWWLFSSPSSVSAICQCNLYQSHGAGTALLTQCGRIRSGATHVSPISPLGFPEIGCGFVSCCSSWCSWRTRGSRNGLLRRDMKISTKLSSTIPRA